MEWCKTSETATALGRNYYQVWKTSETAMVLGCNYYPVWNGGRHLRLLQYSFGTTIKYWMMEDVRNCYGIWSELLPNMVTRGQDCYDIRLRSFVGSRWLDSWSTESWDWNRSGWCLILIYGKEAGWFQGECLRLMTSTTLAKRNLMTNGNRQMRKPDSRSKKNKK